MRRVTLAEIAQARSGDKGDMIDLSLFAPNADVYRLLAEQVTAERVLAHFDGLVKGACRRYEVPKLLALKFLLHGALMGGAARSLRADNLGKCFGPNFLRLTVDLPDDISLEGIR